MSKFIEIGGLIKKGLGQKVVKKFSENSDVISVGYANEADILTLIVKERKGNVIFDELYKHLKLNSQKNGVIYKSETISKSSVK